MKHPTAEELRLLAIDRGQPMLGPETIHVDVTNGCNTNCVTCWDHSPLLQVGRSAAWKRQRIELDTVAGILDDAAKLGGLRAVILSGMGEPFTHPEIYEMIAEVKGRGLHLTVITNLVAADPALIMGLRVDQLLVGIHGASEESYTAFHPSFSSREWNRLHEMLQGFAAAGRRYKQVHVICATNAHELPQMVEQAARYRAAQVNFKLAGLRGGTEGVRITETQRSVLLDSGVPRAQAVAARLGVETNLEVFAAQLGAGGGKTAPIEEIGCFMGYVYARVLVDGTVLYCCSTEVRVGHLSEGRLDVLWRGAAWQGLRERLRRGEYFAGCQQCGKLNQNVQLGRRYEAVYGAERLLQVTGRGRAGERGRGRAGGGPGDGAGSGGLA